jgi:hypothetical protein
MAPQLRFGFEDEPTDYTGRGVIRVRAAVGENIALAI